MGKFFKISSLTNMQSIIKVDDKWFKPRDKVTNENKGVTYMPTGDGSPDVIWENHGLKKFKGKYMNPDEKKNSTGYKGNYVENVTIPHKQLGKNNG